jgi:uncharacterized cofD-like protein
MANTHSSINHDGAFKVVAIGGGTGLPSVLRGLKAHTSNITAVVTMADDGGSSGKLRRELGVLPPGDLRNNIAALANDEVLMTQLFQYRFGEGGLEGHSFGNLLLTALASITGSMDAAVIEAGKVLNIRGRVLPSTLEDVVLQAEVRNGDGSLTLVQGESQIPEVEGHIQRVEIIPAQARAYPDALNAILNADLIVIGPGSLFTSILPNLLIHDLRQALQVSPARRVYICNNATQRGETDNFGAVEHILALESHIGEALFTDVLTNNATPQQNAGERTRYVSLVPPDHPVRQRYIIHEADLTDPMRPWRHSPEKLSKALLALLSPKSQGLKA